MDFRKNKIVINNDYSNIFILNIVIILMYNSILNINYEEFYYGKYSIEFFNFSNIYIIDLIYNLFKIKIFNDLYSIIIISLCVLFIFYKHFVILFSISVLYYLGYIRNAYILDGGDNVLAIILPLIILTQFCKDYKFYSYEKIILTFIKLQFCLIYFFAGFNKIIGDKWINGTAIYYIMNVDEFNCIGFHNYFNKPFVTFIISYFTIIFELYAIVFIWFDKFRKFVIILGVILHCSILIIMRIDFFSLIMLNFYILFLKKSEMYYICGKINNIYEQFQGYFSKKFKID